MLNRPRLSYDIIILDLEANQPSSKIIEIGAVRLLRDGGIHPNKFQTFVKIDEPLQKFIINLTNITENDLKDAPEFAEAFKMFEDWAYSESRNILLSAWGGWDIPLLRKHCEDHGVKYSFRGKTMDIKSIVVFLSMLYGKRLGSDGLGKALKKWEVKFEGRKHRADADAYNTAKLIQKIWYHHVDQGQKIIKALNQLGIAELYSQRET